MRTREDLTKVFDDTINQILEYKFEQYSVYKNKFSNLSKEKLPDNNKTNISVENIDCMIAAERLSKLGRTCVLNMASHKKPGGGVRTGAMAQEEELCRRSNLFCGLKNGFYPIADNEYIYMNNVTFFKDGEYKNITPFVCDVITVPAMNLSSDKVILSLPKKIYTKTTKDKIEAMFIEAHKNGCKNLVLSAFGCGVFKNNPTVMANMFKEVLESGWNKVYDNVVFAIINDKNSVANNFTKFKVVLD